MLAASVEPRSATAAIPARPRTTFEEEFFLRVGREEFSNFNISILFYSPFKLDRRISSMNSVI
jgi:hypothetical protein